MPVSGIVITCAAEDLQGVAGQAAAIEGVEVHGVLPAGQIVAVIETDTVDGEVSLVSQLQGLDGVISVMLAYHNFEDVTT